MRVLNTPAAADTAIFMIGFSRIAVDLGFLGLDPVEGKFPFAAIGRALSIDEAGGWVKVIGDKKTDKLLGVHMIGPEITEPIAKGALAIELGSTVSDVAQTIHAHPLLPEGVMEAAEAVHILQKPSAAKKAAPASV